MCVNTTPRRKHISRDHRESIVAAHQSRKGYKAISKPFNLHRTTLRKIIHKWKTFKIFASLPRSGRPSKFTPRSDHAMIREITKTLRVASQTLQASVSMINVKIHTRTIRRRLKKYGLFGRVARRKRLLSKKNMVAQLRFAKLHLVKIQDFWNNVL